jgi:glycosyltransferase involved in cell wall biosynthesis
VVFVSLPPSLGGSIRALETHLAVLGRDDSVLAAPAGTSAADYLMATGSFAELVDVTTRGPLRSVALAVGARRLHNWALDHRAEVAAIHANGMPEMAVAWSAARAIDIPLVVWAHGAEVPRLVRRTRSVWRRHDVDVRWAAVSAAASKMILRSGVATEERMHVVPNPIDPDVVRVERVPEADVTRLAFLGGTSIRKGFDILPAMMERLADLPVRLYLAGRQPEHDDETWLRLQAHGDRVVCLGALSDVREIYGVSDIILMPSRNESFGRVAAEAMMNGIPLVAFDIPALREVIGDGGLLTPVDDVDELADAVRRLAATPGLADRLGAVGRDRAKAYVPATVSNQLCELYGLTRTG